MDRIRAANRAALGLAGGSGLGQIPSVGALGGVVNSVAVSTAFPEVEIEYRTGDAEPSAEGSGWGQWLTAHVLRPRVTVGTIGGKVDLDPWRDVPDYSGLARVVAVGVGVATAAGIAFVVARALRSYRRRNPRRFDARTFCALPGGRW
jgi:hypothetical protein